MQMELFTSAAEKAYLPTMLAPCELAAHCGYEDVRSVWSSVLTESFLNRAGYTRDELRYRKRLPLDLTSFIYREFKISSIILQK